jgi:translation elongation factor EF-1beta
LVNKIQETRNNIKEALNKPSAASDSNLETRIETVEAENKALKTELAALTQRFSALESRLNNLGSGAAPVPKAAAPAPAEEDDDDDVDLFGSDDEDDDEAEKIKAARVAAYNERKAAKEAKKGVLIAKSNIILDVKPWSDETDMAALESEVRKIETDGLLWGAAKLVPVGYGIKKLQICCVVEDDKVGTDFLEEEICALEEYVQSVDVAAFNKI